MKATFCGVRGSTPSPGPEFQGHGGHTSCIAVAQDGKAPTLILDAGTGIRRVSHLLAGAPFRGVLLLSHLHWDHTQGLPFFAAGDREDAVVDLFMPAQGDAAAVLGRAMGPPHFPIGPEGLRGRWRFRGLDEGVHDLAGFEVIAREIPHKGGRTYGYRVSDGRSSLAYLPDHGPTALGPGPHGHGPYHEAAVALAGGVDVLVHDAQHTAEEFPRMAGYGHSSIEYAVGLAAEAGVGRLVLFHHSPSRTDAALDRIAAHLSSSVPVVVASEPMELVLPPIGS
ncbi:MAG: MBL fold metallo-hydrolase [Acidimicrobiales bacterium]